jgi:hypothetical protein
MSRFLVERSYWVHKAPADIREKWPGAVQIAACRTRHIPRNPRHVPPADEVHYYVVVGPAASRPLSPKRVASLIRGHWGIENRLQHVKDRTFREDDQLVRCGAVALCWMRTVTLTLLSAAESANKGRRRYMPEIRSHYCAKPSRVIALMRRGH